MDIKKTDYVELQVSSNFSFLHGASHPEELVTQANSLGYSAIAITDRHTLAGMVRAHVAAKEQGISLIIGTRIDPSTNSTAGTTTPDVTSTLPPLLLYPTNRSAYGRLSKLLTRGKTRAPKGECYLTHEDLLEHQQDLFCTIIANHHPAMALEATVTSLLRGFSAHQLSLSISRRYGPDDSRFIEQAHSLSQRYNIPLVAVNDVHYHTPERRMLQDILVCIRSGITIDQAGYRLFPNGERHLKPPQEMPRLFRDLPRAILRSREIAEAASSFSLDELRYEYPREIYPEDKTPLEYLTSCTWEGAQRKYPQGVPDSVKQQIQYELKLIAELNYPEYFLTVYDIVNFARSREILCQGRGAAANSAVCFCLGITSVDPARINMLFERFISKERNEPPDIDIDFEHERREEVIQYVYQKYGRHRAALVCEVITYRGRLAVREVAKALGFSLGCIDILAKSVHRWSNREIPPECIKEAGLNINDSRIALLLKLTKTIIGFPRHLSQHVGGFVIAHQDLSEIVPIENAAMEDRTVIEWDKDDIEALGMLKIDLLALGMLTCIRKAFTLINSRAANTISKQVLALHAIPAEDPQVYDMICAADTLGVFQIESRAQMSMLPRLKPRCYYDLVIEVAIVRPGPIQGNMVHPYLKRRSGLIPTTYPDAQIQKILERTLGVPLFQEQAMQLAIVGAGFSPGEADNLRRAIAGWKRKGNQLLPFEQKIIKGMLAKGYSEEFARSCFEQIKGFSGYGFPESHAASFALLVYVSAWLKRHYPASFAAALLNSQPMGFYQPAQIVDCAKRHGVEVRPIDVNHSFWDCSLEEAAGEKTTPQGRISTSAQPKHQESQLALRLGLRMVRGLSQSEATLVTNAVATHGGFKNILALFKKSGVRVHSLRLLALADAFNSMNLTRQEALWAIAKLRDAPMPLFEQTLTEPTERKETRLPTIPEQELVLKDYDRTGLSLKAHPVKFIRPALNKHYVVQNYLLKDTRLLHNGQTVIVAGIVLVRQRPMTASGVMFLTIEDETGIANLIVRPEIYERYRKELRDGVCISAQGKLQRVEGVVHILTTQVSDISQELSGYDSMSRDFR